MPSNVEGWLKRAEEFSPRAATGFKSGEALNFATSMATAFYGPNSQQVEMIKRRADSIPKEKGNAHIMVYEFAAGCIANMVAEIKGGLVQQIRLGIVGEVLADLIGMAREALAENSVQVSACWLLQHSKTS